MFENILLVCVGNICRSPMAEALLKGALHKKGKKNHKVSSAGLGAMVDSAPDKIAVELMLEKGIDISSYRATQLNSEIIHQADLILVMETAHKAFVEHKEPSAKGKVFRLGRWDGFDVADPYRQEREVFTEAVALIEKGVSSWADKI